MTFVGAIRDPRAARAASTAFVAFALGVFAYGVVGFGFQFGGVGLVTSGPDFKDLVREWSVFDRAFGAGWGLIALDAFGVVFSPRSEAELVLYVYHGALAGTATLLPILALAPRVRSRVLVLGSFIWGALIYPIAGNWIWGGGWLSQLGRTMNLGHGAVDYAGALTVFFFGGLSAVGALAGYGLRPAPRATNVAIELPRAHLPILMILGTLIAFVGMTAVALANPLYQNTAPVIVVFANLINATLAGIVTASLYSWLVGGEASPVLATRGALAGMISVGASLAFIAPGSALLIGAAAGILVPLTAFAVERWLRLDDPALIISTTAVSGLWGAIALAIFATGQIGQGWNRTGEGLYLAVKGQGVSGIFVAPGFAPDMPGQLEAQVIGALAIGLFAYLLALAVFFSLRRVGGEPEP